jgi:hypothetical protein
MATTTPNYGWDVPTSTDYVADGAVAIETLGDDIDATLYTALGGAYPGLRLIKKQTIGSGVSSVTVTDAFSATYENYKILISGGSASSNTNMTFQYGATAGTSYKFVLIYADYNNTPKSLGSTGTSGFTYGGNATTNGLSALVEVNSPFLTKNTRVRSDWFSPTEAGVLSGIIDTTLSYTSFTFNTGAITMTGGTIYVYGYGAS